MEFKDTKTKDYLKINKINDDIKISFYIYDIDFIDKVWFMVPFDELDNLIEFFERGTEYIYRSKSLRKETDGNYIIIRFFDPLRYKRDGFEIIQNANNINDIVSFLKNLKNSKWKTINLKIT